MGHTFIFTATYRAFCQSVWSKDALLLLIESEFKSSLFVFAFAVYTYCLLHNKNGLSEKILYTDNNVGDINADTVTACCHNILARSRLNKSFRKPDCSKTNSQVFGKGPCVD